MDWNIGSDGQKGCGGPLMEISTSILYLVGRRGPQKNLSRGGPPFSSILLGSWVWALQAGCVGSGEGKVGRRGHCRLTMVGQVGRV